MLISISLVFAKTITSFDIVCVPQSASDATHRKKKMPYSKASVNGQFTLFPFLILSAPLLGLYCLLKMNIAATGTFSVP